MTRKKTILSSLLFFLTFFSASSPHLLLAQEPTGEQKATPQTNIAPYSRLTFALLFLELFIANNKFTDNDAALNRFIQQIEPKNLIFNFLHEYSHHFLTTFFHECGHALAAKFFQGDPINIHLGANSNTQEEPLLSTSMISLDGLSPTAGYSVCTSLLDQTQEMQLKMIQLLPNFLKKQGKNLKDLSQEEILILLKELQKSPEIDDFIKKSLENNKNTSPSKAKLAVILLAGGLAGIIGHHLIKLGTTVVHNHLHKQDQTLWQNLAAAGKQALVPDNITIYQLFNMLMPFSISDKHHSDASKLYIKCLSASPELIQTLSKAAIPLHLTSEFLLMYAQSPKEAQLLNIILLTLLNYQLRGYLYFKL